MKAGNLTERRTGAETSEINMVFNENRESHSDKVSLIHTSLSTVILVVSSGYSHHSVMYNTLTVSLTHISLIAVRLTFDTYNKVSLTHNSLTADNRIHKYTTTVSLTHKRFISVRLILDTNNAAS